jgi:phasin family protein
MAAVIKKDAPAGDFHPFHDLNKTLEQFKVPGVDMSAFVAARRKDVEALTAANKAVYEALQDLGRTQTEMLTHAMKGIQESAEGMLKKGVKGADTTGQTEAARAAWQRMLADIKALAELARKSQAQAVAGLTETAAESTKIIENLVHTK